MPLFEQLANATSPAAATAGRPALTKDRSAGDIRSAETNRPRVNRGKS